LSDLVWSGHDVTPADVEAALRDLLIRYHAESDVTDAPARVLNLIAVVDRQWRGEIENRLERVGRYHASRTVLCAVEQGRKELDATARIIADDEGKGGEFALTHEHVVLELGPQHLEHLFTVVDPLVVTDLPTMVWAPHGHQDAVDQLLSLAQITLLDSVQEPDLGDAIRRARDLADKVYVVDLAWLRSTPWRERVAATFDPPQFRAELGAISSVTIRHHPDSGAAGMLFFGWLATRLGWSVGPLYARNGGYQGRARGKRQEVALMLDPEPDQSVVGLAGITLETAQGTTISLDRGPGGLHAHRRTRKGKESEWTVLGASRGEAGILGEGIRQAMLRDPTYRPALDAAATMVS
jgi:glucose-6-phosphate dehydrogenase assembly protein OpcA